MIPIPHGGASFQGAPLPTGGIPVRHCRTSRTRPRWLTNAILNQRIYYSMRLKHETYAELVDSRWNYRRRSEKYVGIDIGAHIPVDGVVIEQVEDV